MRVVIAHGAFQGMETTGMFLGVAVTGWIYLRGSTRLPGTRDRTRRGIAFTGALVLLVLAFSHPVEDAAAQLFTFHMAQHLALLVPIPVLAIYAHGGRCLMRGIPRRLRPASLAARRAGHRLAPLAAIPVAGVVFALTLWGWHVPAIYDAAVTTGWVHLLEHAAFLGSALLLWTAVLDARRGFLTRSMLVFGTAFHSGLLGAALVFAPVPLYRSHLTTSWGITPLQDQQLAGAIMWIPLGAVYLVTVAALVIRGFEQTNEAADA